VVNQVDPLRAGQVGDDRSDLFPSGGTPNEIEH